MNAVKALAVIGIILGLGLIFFSVIGRKRLPSWGRLAFPMIGFLIALSGILIALGANAL